jgi:hypothetical protein
MIDRYGFRNVLSVAIIAVVMILCGAEHIGRQAAAGDYTPTPDGTPTLPTPVVDTPTPTVIPEETSTPVIISELPATGAGTTAREFVQSEHTYQTVHRYCWHFAYGVWYYAEEVTVWGHNWWGSGHYALYQVTNNYGRCYVS